MSVIPPSGTLEIQFIGKVTNELGEMNIKAKEHLRNSAEIFLKTRENDPEYAANAYLNFKEKLDDNEFYKDPSQYQAFLDQISHFVAHPLITRIDSANSLYINPDFIHPDQADIKTALAFFALNLKASIFKFNLHDGKPLSIVFDFTDIGIRDISKDHFAELIFLAAECMPIVIDRIYFLGVSFFLKPVMKILMAFSEDKDIYDDLIVFVDQEEIVAFAENPKLLPVQLGGSMNIDESALMQWNGELLKYSREKFTSTRVAAFPQDPNAPLDTSKIAENEIKLPNSSRTAVMAPIRESSNYNDLVSKIISIKTTTGLEKFFASLKNVEKDHKTSSFHAEKNRQRDTPCFEDTRVILKDGANDYINANYVPGENNDPKYYILTQAPMKSTTEDFWRMIWEQNCEFILMFTPFINERNEEKCCQYFPLSENDTLTFGAYKIMCTTVRDKDAFSIRTLNVFSDEYPSMTKSVHHFRRNGEVSNVFLELHAVDDLVKKNDIKSPIVIHDSSGTRQGAVFLLLHKMRARIQKRAPIDIGEMIEELRGCRAKSIRTDAEFLYLVKTICHYLRIKKLISPLNFDRLRNNGIM